MFYIYIVVVIPKIQKDCTNKIFAFYTDGVYLTQGISDDIQDDFASQTDSILATQSMSDGVFSSRGMTIGQWLAYDTAQSTIKTKICQFLSFFSIPTFQQGNLYI